MPPPRVLSIQSHVASGYVGTRVAEFALQRLGFLVDVLHTTALSNHTGYANVNGHRPSAAHLRGLYFDGLVPNGMARYDYVIVGYVGRAELVGAVTEVVKDVKRRNPSVIVVVDPVLGDNGKLYVPKDVVQRYIDDLCPLADIITPNAFETDTLLCASLQTKECGLLLANKLHRRFGVKYAVITSVKLEDDEQQLYMFGSFCRETTFPHTFTIEFPRIEGNYTGTGDLFAALLLAYLHDERSKPRPAHADVPDQNDMVTFELACMRTAKVLRLVLLHTSSKAQDMLGLLAPDQEQPSATDTLRSRELALVECQDALTQSTLLAYPEITIVREPWYPNGFSLQAMLRGEVATESPWEICKAEWR